MADVVQNIIDIRSAENGLVVRETIADGIESINEEVESTTSRQTVIEGTIAGAIELGGNPSLEVGEARKGETSLGAKIDKIDENIQNHATELANIPSQIDAKIGTIGNTKTFKGSCLFASLPITGMLSGDYWYVTDKTSNYCYNGTSWIDIGNNINIGDGTIASKSTKFINIGKNIYDKRTSILNKYQLFGYRTNTYLANLVASDIYGVSALIPVNGSPINFVCKNVNRLIGYRADGTTVSDLGVTLVGDHDSITINPNTGTDAITAISVRFLIANIDSVILILGTVFDANAIYGEGYDNLIVAETNLTKELKSKINAINSAPISNNATIFFPHDIYTKINEVHYLEKDNVISAKNLGDFSINGNGSPTGGFNDKVILPSFTFSCPFDVEDSKTGMIIQTNTVRVRRVDYTLKQAPTVAKNVLVIGDSYSDAGYIPCDIKKQLVNDCGFTNFKFIGTRTDTINGVTALNEGKGGYTLNDFLKTVDTGGRGVGYPNPFLSGGVVNLHDYMTRNAISGDIDYVILELGVNNYVATTVEGTNTPTLITAKAKQFIDMIHVEYPNCKIFLTGLIYISDINGQTNPTTHNAKVMNLNSAYQTMVEGLTGNAGGVNLSSFCYYVDAGAMFKRNYGFQYNMVTYRGGIEAYKQQTDWLHPSECGYYMISDRIVACILTWLANK